VNGPRQRISARDYKHGGGRRGGFDLRKYQQFGWGLAAGLLVALGVFVHGQRQKSAEEENAAKPVASKVVDETPVAGANDAAAQFDFYDKLPNAELDVSARKAEIRRLPSVPIEQPGAYMIQAGSFRNEAEASRQRDKLAKLGIDAAVQRIAVDADVTHRVRIGPVRDLAKLNAIRASLRKADIEAYLFRLPD
jgi:cell division protein FtsN